MRFDNIVIHTYPDSPCIAKCAVNFRNGKKIVDRVVLKDRCAAINFIVSRFPITQIETMKTIVHRGA